MKWNTCLITRSLKLEKSSVRTISLCPLLGDHFFHLVHIPVVQLIHHHLNDGHHLPIGNTMDQQPTLSPTWSQLQYSLQLLHHLADPLGDLIAHIGHLHTSLPLHHHLNDDLQLQFALLASSASSELVSSSARVTSAKSQPKVLEVFRGTRNHRPDPRDTWVQ